MDKPLDDTSKFLSFVLRHQPEAIGLSLDREGWADLDALIEAAGREGRSLTRELIRQVVDTNDKKRFALSEDGQRIRAVQGHSSQAVAREYEPVTPPEQLFHGTATRFLEGIRQDGLVAMSRHHVHLSADHETAVSVGQRHGKVVVLTVAAREMHRRGHRFFLAENGVWLTEQVPPEFLKEG